MSGKVYKKDKFMGKTQVKDSTWAANEYFEGAKLLAEGTAKIQEAKEKFEAAMNVTQDNGDPYFATDEALIKLAVAMADALNYHKEYAEEANPSGEEEESEEEK